MNNRTPVIAIAILLTASIAANIAMYILYSKSLAALDEEQNRKQSTCMLLRLAMTEQADDLKKPASAEQRGQLADAYFHNRHMLSLYAYCTGAPNTSLLKMLEKCWTVSTTNPDCVSQQLRAAADLLN